MREVNRQAFVKNLTTESKAGVMQIPTATACLGPIVIECSRSWLWQDGVSECLRIADWLDVSFHHRPGVRVTLHLAGPVSLSNILS